MKRFLAAMLLISLALTLCACGETDGPLFDGGSADAAQEISSYLKSNGFATKEIHKDLEDLMRAYRWNGQEQEMAVGLGCGEYGGEKSVRVMTEGIDFFGKNQYSHDPDTGLSSNYSFLQVGEGAPDDFLFPLNVSIGTSAADFVAVFNLGEEDLAEMLTSSEAVDKISLFAEGERTVTFSVSKGKDGTVTSFRVSFSETEGEYVDDVHPSFQRGATFYFSGETSELTTVTFWFKTNSRKAE